MRTLIHLSDPHFGQVDDSTFEAIAVAARGARPDVVVITGDVTQRAARRFLDALPAAHILAHGNDTGNLEPFYEDDELVVAMVNTEDGRISDEQLDTLRERLCAYPEEVTKIVVTHHPFDLPEGDNESDLVSRAPAAIEALARCGADVLLAGHLHLNHTGHTARRYNTNDHSVLFVQAGTATSTRGRGEPNSFNLLRVQHPHIQVERFSWHADIGAFKPASSETFHHTPDGWTRLSDEVAAGITFAHDTTGLQPSIPQD